MVAASIMGFEPAEVLTFATAHRIGMTPTRLHQIELRGARVAKVRQALLRPAIHAWGDIRNGWATREP